MNKELKTLSGAELLDLARQGYAPAYSVFYERYCEHIISAIKTRVRDKETIEELVQDTFELIWKNASRFDPTNNIKTWIYIIAQNRATDHYRFQTSEFRIQYSKLYLIEFVHENPTLTHTESDEELKLRTHEYGCRDRNLERLLNSSIPLDQEIFPRLETLELEQSQAAIQLILSEVNRLKASHRNAVFYSMCGVQSTEINAIAGITPLAYRSQTCRGKSMLTSRIIEEPEKVFREKYTPQMHEEFRAMYESIVFPDNRVVFEMGRANYESLGIFFRTPYQEFSRAEYADIRTQLMGQSAMLHASKLSAKVQLLE